MRSVATRRARSGLPSSKVTGLEEHPYESQSLRKSAIVTANRRLAPHDVAGEQTFLTCELVTTGAETWTYFLAGSPSERRLQKQEGAISRRTLVAIAVTARRCFVRALVSLFLDTTPLLGSPGEGGPGDGGSGAGAKGVSEPEQSF